MSSAGEEAGLGRERAGPVHTPRAGPSAASRLGEEALVVKAGAVFSAFFLLKNQREVKRRR